LPGGPAASFRGTGHESLERNIIPKKLNPSIPQQPQIYVPPPPHAFQSYRPTIQGIPGVAHRTSGIYARKAATQQSRPLSSPAYVKSQSDAPPDAHYQLGVPWKTLVSNIRVGRAQLAAQVARDNLDEVCLKTDTFIGTPADLETKLPIWGVPEQVEQALTMLQSFELHVRQAGIRPMRGKWDKSGAFDGRVASRLEEVEREEAMAEGLRIHAQEREYDFEAFLLWPDEIDIDKFVAQQDAAFKEIRGSVLCKIEFFSTGVKHVKISADSDTQIKQIYARLVNMVKEEIAQHGRLLVANRFRLPRASMYRTRVGIDPDPVTNLYLATLHGKPLPESELDDWRKLCHLEDEKNVALISGWVDSSLRSLRASRRHVRMRATFGELGFSQLELPPDGESDYDFEAFCAMVVKQRTTIESSGLRYSGRDLAGLVDVLSEMKEFSELESRCVLHFDFEIKGQTVRFESEFEPTHGSNEMEICSSRWLEFGTIDDSEILEVNVLDFECPQTNWQFHIGASRLYSPPDGLHSFASNVRFNAPPSDINAPRRCRAVYPPGSQALSKVEENHIARLRFKQGHGSFELQRKDIYNEQPKTSTPMESRWTARYYYPEWDNLMGHFASVEPGEEVPWARTLSTFFIDPKATHDARALPKGFDGFIKEVQKISRLLQTAMERLPEGEATNGVHTNRGIHR
jgi:hypothetical protein